MSDARRQRAVLERLCAASCLLFLFGCATDPVRQPLSRPTASSSPPEVSGAPAPETATVAGRTLIYRVQNGRAADLAAAIRPFLERRYGAGASVVPLVHSNTILVRLPPAR